MFGTPGSTIWTIGHSTRTWEEFLSRLREHRIEFVADVRHFPSSKHVPWTNGPSVSAALAASNIGYVHLVDLGGYRRPLPNSVNAGWRNGGFRGYADQMATPEFRAALDRLVALAAERRTAIMCAEAIPWKCHRSLLSDALLARGGRVLHIMGPGQAEEHRLTPFANVRGGRVTYPGPKEKALKRPRR